MRGGVVKPDYWRTHGGVLPGCIIGTAGAERYTLPPDTAGATDKKAHVYGYLLATVRPKEEKGDVVQFEFKELSEQDLLAAVGTQYGVVAVHDCFVNNPPLPPTAP